MTTFNKEVFFQALDAYTLAKARQDVLKDLSDYFQKYIHKLEHRETELKEKIERYKKSGKNEEALKAAIHDSTMNTAQINAALKLEKEFMERLLETAKEVGTTGASFLELCTQNPDLNLESL